MKRIMRKIVFCELSVIYTSRRFHCSRCFTEVCVCAQVVSLQSHTLRCLHVICFSFAAQRPRPATTPTQHGIQASAKTQQHTNQTHSKSMQQVCRVIHMCSLHLQISWWHVSFVVSLWPNLRVKYLEPHIFTLNPPPPRRTLLSFILTYCVLGLQQISRLRFTVRLQAVTTLQSLVTCHDTCGTGAVCWWRFGSTDRDCGNWTKAMTTEMHVSAVLQRGNNVQNSQPPRSDPSLWEDRC